MADFDRLKKNIYIINIHLHKKEETKTNMIQNFIQNNHGVSTVNHVTHGHINAGKNDVLDTEPFIDSYTEPAAKPFTKATKEEHEAYIKINFDPITRSMLEDFPDLPYKKQLKVLTYMEDVKLED
jgi:hypothetical protein